MREGPKLDDLLGGTEDFLRRQLGSRAAREANKRKVQRGIGEVLRRVRRAAILLFGLLAALIGYSIFVDSIGFLIWLVILPTVFLAALITLFWPSRRRPRRMAADEAPPLGTLAGDAEEWLLERCRELPRAAHPAVDAILARLGEMQPDLAALPASEPLAGEAQRLIGRHLPRLVDTYLELPASERQPQGETSRRFTESLEICADELDRLGKEIGQNRALRFETQRRFIETRYRDGTD